MLRIACPLFFFAVVFSACGDTAEPAPTPAPETPTPTAEPTPEWELALVAASETVALAMDEVLAGRQAYLRDPDAKGTSGYLRWVQHELAVYDLLREAHYLVQHASSGIPIAERHRLNELAEWLRYNAEWFGPSSRYKTINDDRQPSIPLMRRTDGMLDYLQLVCQRLDADCDTPKRYTGD